MANINFFCKDVVMLTAKMGVNVNVFDKRELVAAIKQCMGVVWRPGPMSRRK